MNFDRDIAVGVISFDRPEFFKRTVNHLENCVDKDRVDWYFFQDGAVNKFSGERHASDFDIEKNIEIIEEANIPNKHILVNDVNLGNAIQTDKCFKLFDKDYDLIIRIEEDIILSKYFIRVLISIHDQFPNYVTSAYNMGSISDKNIPDDLTKVSEDAGAFLVSLMSKNIFRDIENRWEDFRDIIWGTDWWVGGHRPQQVLRQEFGDNSRGCDGVLDSILNEHGYGVIGPVISRGSNIGVYGMNLNMTSFDNSDRFGDEGKLEYDIDKNPPNWEMI